MLKKIWLGLMCALLLIAFAWVVANFVIVATNCDGIGAEETPFCILVDDTITN